ncbi:MAG TPA: hypothetical protein VF553_13535 [Pyrinomonadaceae bacterium]|jgi:hypothetical protein
MKTKSMMKDESIAAMNSVFASLYPVHPVNSLLELIRGAAANPKSGI